MWIWVKSSHSLAATSSLRGIKPFYRDEQNGHSGQQSKTPRRGLPSLALSLPALAQPLRDRLALAFGNRLTALEACDNIQVENGNYLENRTDCMPSKREDLSIEERVRKLIRDLGPLRPRDLAAHGIPPRYASRLAQRGVLERVDRGLYAAADAEINEYQTLLEVSRRIPNGVICLLSALRFHELTTQTPFEVWVMVDDHAYVPRVTQLPVRIIYSSGASRTEGIEEHHILGALLPVTGPAKTVADCFKYRSKVGLDVALEALRESWRARRVTMDELWRYAEICRVARVMRPYLESLETLS